MGPARRAREAVGLGRTRSRVGWAVGTAAPCCGARGAQGCAGAALGASRWCLGVTAHRCSQAVSPSSRVTGERARTLHSQGQAEGEGANAETAGGCWEVLLRNGAQGRPEDAQQPRGPQALGVRGLRPSLRLPLCRAAGRASAQGLPVLACPPRCAPERGTRAAARDLPQPPAQIHSGSPHRPPPAASGQGICSGQGWEVLRHTWPSGPLPNPVSI